MAKTQDWFPGRRELQLAMAKIWLIVLLIKAALWGVPEAECTALANLTAEADRIPTLAMSGERTPVITAQCREAFNALAEKMRFLKNRYFLIFASPGNLRFLYRAYKTVVNSRNVIYEV